jgi:hypothetical protein
MSGDLGYQQIGSRTELRAEGNVAPTAARSIAGPAPAGIGPASTTTETTWRDGRSYTSTLTSRLRPAWSDGRPAMTT